MTEILESVAVPSPKRGKYAKTPARRQEILEAATEVFSTQGFRSGSIRDVADRVGISQAGLLHHFANKNELLAAVLQLRDDHASALVDFEAEPGLGTLRGMLQTMAYNATVPGLVELHCVLSAEATAPDHPAHEYFVNRYDWVLDYLTDAFVTLHARGGLVPGAQPKSAARGLIAVMDGLQVQWLLQGHSFDMAEETRRYMNSLLVVPL